MHAADELAPVTLEYVPGGHFMHKLPDKYSPAAQVIPTHTLSALAPSVLDDFPTAQAMQVLAPDVLAYVLAVQFKHTFSLFAPVTIELLPAAQLIHWLAFVAPDTPKYAPAGQLIHAEFPVTFLNFPASQVIQTPPSGPVYPMLHLQSLIPELNIGELLFAGHAEHDVCRYLSIHCLLWPI
jgi:hypothetical protein